MAILVDTAVRAGYGYDTALDMSPRQLSAVARLYDQRSRQDLILAATAARAGMSDKKDWMKWTGEVSDGA